MAMEQLQAELPRPAMPASPKKFPRKQPVLILLALLLLGGVYAVWAYQNGLFPFQKTTPPPEDTSGINPTDFSSTVDNKYFTLTPGKKMVYRQESTEDTARLVVYVTREKKEVLGVETVAVWDGTWEGDELVEANEGWYAQHKNGDVWYFGENTLELEDGEVVDSEGSWVAGFEGAEAGRKMLADPKVGDSYPYVTLYGGLAEERMDVLALGKVVTVPSGKFTDCLKVLEHKKAIEPGVESHKYYCPEVGGLALEVELKDGERMEEVKLLSVEYDAEAPLAFQEFLGK